MPTYQYACTECGHGFETVQSFSEDALTECPQCTGRLRKVFNSVGIVFKGSGFYRTDSREKPTDAGAGGKDGGKDGAASGAGDKKKDTPAAASSGAGTSTGSGGSPSSGGSSPSAAGSSRSSSSGASSTGSSSSSGSAA